MSENWKWAFALLAMGGGAACMVMAIITNTAENGAGFWACGGFLAWFIAMELVIGESKENC